MISGNLAKLEGHRGSVTRSALSKRWRTKWVVCDKEQLAYYAKPNDTNPRKTLFVKDLRVVLNEGELQMVVTDLKSTDSYEITFKCSDRQTFATWSRFYRSTDAKVTVDIYSNHDDPDPKEVHNKGQRTSLESFEGSFRVL